MIVPTLCVGMHPVMLRVTTRTRSVQRGIPMRSVGTIKYAANQRIEAVDVDVAKGLAEQAQRFKQEGSQLYKKV